MKKVSYSIWSSEQSFVCHIALHNDLCRACSHWVHQLLFGTLYELGWYTCLNLSFKDNVQLILIHVVELLGSIFSDTLLPQCM